MGMTPPWPARRPTVPAPGRPALPSRRAVLLATALAAGLTPALTAPASAADPADPADAYEALRRRWLDIALGTGYDPAREPYASRLAQTGALARGFRATMAPARTPSGPGTPSTRPPASPSATGGCGP